MLQAIEQDPMRSIRNAAEIVNLSFTTTQRILKDKMHVYHFSRMQNLMPLDYNNRINFCMWILERYREDPHFVENIMFTDESMFTRKRIFNTHNFYFYADENPHVYHIGNYQHKFSINLWVGIYKDSVASITFNNNKYNNNKYFIFYFVMLEIKALNAIKCVF
jgi:hypothetical protein